MIAQPPNCMGLCMSDCQQNCSGDTCANSDHHGPCRSCCAHTCGDKCEEQCKDLPSTSSYPGGDYPGCTSGGMLDNLHEGVHGILHCSGQRAVPDSTAKRRFMQPANKSRSSTARRIVRPTVVPFSVTAQFLNDTTINACAEQLSTDVNIQVDVHLAVAAHASGSGSITTTSSSESHKGCTVARVGSSGSDSGLGLFGLFSLGAVGFLRNRKSRAAAVNRKDVS